MKEKRDKPTFKKDKTTRFIVKTTFFISYQDPSFEHRYNYASDSHGLISFFSEYDWASSMFVFQNPAFRLIDFERVKKVKEKTNSRPKFHIDYIGFGGINKALLQKMITFYYLPETSEKEDYRGNIYPEMSFRVFDKCVNGPESDERTITKEEITSLYPSCKLGTGGENFLPQYAMPSLEVYAKNFLLNKDLNEYCDSLTKEILNLGEQVMIIVAVGSTHDNIEIAAKIRSRIKQDKDDKKLIEKLGNSGEADENGFTSKKSILIYPYIKESSLFRADYHRYYVNGELFKNQEGKKFSVVDPASYEASRLYVHEVNFDVMDLLSFKDVDKKRLHSLIHQLFANEDVPIIAFGRGGYFPSDEERHIMDLAKGASCIYGQSPTSPYRGKDDRFIYSKEYIDKSWGKSLALPYEAKSNFFLALSLTNKVRFLGMRLRPFDYDGTKIDDVDKSNDECLKIIREDIPSFFETNKHVDKAILDDSIKKWKDLIGDAPQGESDIKRREESLIFLTKKMRPIIQKFVNDEVNPFGIKARPIADNEEASYEHALGIYKEYYYHSPKNAEKEKEIFKGYLSSLLKDAPHSDKKEGFTYIRDAFAEKFAITKAKDNANTFLDILCINIVESKALIKESSNEISDAVFNMVTDSYAPFKKYFDQEEKNKVNKKELDIGKKQFFETMSKAFIALWGSWQNVHRKEIIAEFFDPKKKASYLGPYLEASYDISEEPLISFRGRGLAEIEHARWYFFNASNGVMPCPKEAIFNEDNIQGLKFKNKNDLKTVHLCMTNYEGLQEIKHQMVKELPLGYSFLISDFILSSKEDGLFEDVAPHFYSALQSVFSLCYWADTFSVAEIMTILRYRKGAPLTKERELALLQTKDPVKERRNEEQFYYLSLEKKESGIGKDKSSDIETNK